MTGLIKNNAIYELIEKGLQNLPGESSHQEMIPFRLKSTLTIKNSNPKLSAVLCLIYKHEDHLEIILIERQKDGGKHSGQISFPGGKKEESDKNLAETALRESNEEIGIEPSSVRILGKLTNVYIPVSNFSVEPYVGIIDKPISYILSEREVNAVFTIKHNELIDPNSKTHKDISNHQGHKIKNVPCFYIDNKIIWGATSLILNELKEILISIKSEF